MSIKCKPIIVRDPKHLKAMSELPCLVTGDTSGVQVHHLLRSGQKALGRKSGDNYCIPLNHRVHDILHRKGDETGFLKEFGISDPVDVAMTLYLVVHPKDAHEYIINRFSKNWPKNISILTK